MDIILHKIGLVRIVSSFPSILYFVANMFLKLMEGYVLLRKKNLCVFVISPNTIIEDSKLRHYELTKLLMGRSICVCHITRNNKNAFFDANKSQNAKSRVSE